MNKQIYVNLPVADLKKTMDFFGKLGFTFNMQFTNDDAACMVISENNSYVMLLRNDYFKTFINTPVADAQKSTEVLVSQNLNSNKEVDEMIEKAVSLGAKEVRQIDLGFMYNRSFHDLDGHIWEFFFMDMSKFPQE